MVTRREMRMGTRTGSLCWCLMALGWKGKGAEAVLNPAAAGFLAVALMRVAMPPHTARGVLEALVALLSHHAGGWLSPALRWDLPG